MQVITKRPRVVLINFLTAIALSLVVNFFHFVTVITVLSTSTTSQQPMWRNPQLDGWYIVLQVLYFVLMAFILMSICTTRVKTTKNSSNFALRFIICLAIAVLFFFLAPKMTRGGELIFHFQRPPHRIVDSMLILQCSLTLVVALLYGKILDLVYQKQNILLENEVLKNENLQATYNSLVNQINPHFFFNSLNSLAMLVREKHNDKALDYIERLSDSFRYILQNGQADITTLDEEMKFLDAYTYMLDIRYDGKIFFDTTIDPIYREWRLPTLSLLPLIENAVKHNTITKSNPLTITIRTGDDTVIVSNPITPKIYKESGAGIGLENLKARYILLTDKRVSVTDDGKEFTVVLPLLNPKK